MLQFIRILLTNAWRGMRRANVIPAIVMVLASVGVLLVGSSAAASTDGDNPLHAASQAISHVRQMAFGSTTTDRKNLPIGKTHKKPTTNGTGKSTSQSATTQSSNGSNSSTSQQNPGAASTSTTVQLNQVTPTCQQGQMGLTVASAGLTLPSPTTSDGSFAWYWETRIDSGTNSSGTSPVSNAQSQQAIPTGTSQVTLPVSGQSQPLLSVTENSSYAYSFRLHMLIGSTDYASAWVSVSQATGTGSTCQQN